MEGRRKSRHNAKQFSVIPEILYFMKFKVCNGFCHFFRKVVGSVPLTGWRSAASAMQSAKATATAAMLGLTKILVHTELKRNIFAFNLQIGLFY